MGKRKNSKGSKLKCAFCQGKGVQPGAERLSCIVCGGSGRVAVRQPYNVCKECEGTGKKAGTHLYCLSCHGKGFVEEIKYPLMAAPSTGKRKTRARRKKSAKVSKRRIGKSKKSKKSFFKKFFSTLKFL